MGELGGARGGREAVWPLTLRASMPWIGAMADMSSDGRLAVGLLWLGLKDEFAVWIDKRLSPIGVGLWAQGPVR